MELDKDFKEFIELLNLYKVKYLVVGGYSVAHHGFPRYTGDIDIWIKPSPENSKKIMKAINDFGFGSMGLSHHDFIYPDKVIQFGVEPIRIDVMTTINGIPDFDLAYNNRDMSIHDKLKIDFIGYDDLINNKKATNRLQDKRDIQELNKIKRKKGK